MENENPHRDPEMPALRADLEFIPAQVEGHRVYLVRDPLGIIPEGAALPAELGPVLAQMNGTRGADELARVAVGLPGGEAMTPETMRGFLGELSELGFLETERVAAAREAAEAAYAALECRPAALAGRGYPAEPDKLSRLIDAVLGSWPRQEGDDAAPLPKALLAPHIDLAVGGRAYGAAYRSLENPAASGIRRIVVLGVGHQLADGLFALTAKPFDTPLGRVAVDAAAVESLAKAGGRLVSPTDRAHRDEHSVEFQTLFLRHLWPLAEAAGEGGETKAEGPTIVPILCSHFPSALGGFSREAFVRVAGPFLEELRRIAADPATLVVAGVDLCHIGPKFGHDKAAADLESGASTHDAALLAAVCAGDPEALWAEAGRVEDRYHVCGFSALATLLEIVPGLSGQVLAYDVYREEPTASAVSFCAARLQ